MADLLIAHDPGSTARTRGNPWVLRLIVRNENGRAVSSIANRFATEDKAKEALTRVQDTGVWA